MDHARTDEPVCRELISADVRVREGRHIEQKQWCGLPAHEWCATDNIYVCSTHVLANHDDHSRSLAPLSEANEASIEAVERRSGGGAATGLETRLPRSR